MYQSIRLQLSIDYELVNFRQIRLPIGLTSHRITSTSFAKKIKPQHSLLSLALSSLLAHKEEFVSVCFEEGARVSPPPSAVYYGLVFSYLAWCTCVWASSELAHFILDLL